MKKKYGDLYPKFAEWEHLLRAYEGTRKGKKYKANVMAYHDNWEENLINLHEGILWNMWQPIGFTRFPVFEPKERIIEAPVFQDRIVHHAIYDIARPIFETKFIHDSYACRKGKGTHKAVLATQKHLRRCKNLANRAVVYILQMDIKGYFHFIVQKIQKLQISKVIKDSSFLNFWWKVLAIGGVNGVGQPIGAVTSQLGANIYLNDLDHHVKDDLGIKHYVRYMDDFVIIHESKKYLNELKIYLENWLKENLQLELSKWTIYPDTAGIDFAGYRAYPTKIKPRKRNVKNAIKRLRAQYKRGEFEKYRASLASFWGYIKHCTNAGYYYRHVIKVTRDFNHVAANPNRAQPKTA